jgi:hypothetical protein
VKIGPEDYATAAIVIAVLLLCTVLMACVNVSQQCEVQAETGDSSCSNSADGVRPQVLDDDTIHAEPSLL